MLILVNEIWGCGKLSTGKNELININEFQGDCFQSIYLVECGNSLQDDYCCLSKYMWFTLSDNQFRYKRACRCSNRYQWRNIGPNNKDSNIFHCSKTCVGFLLPSSPSQIQQFIFSILYTLYLDTYWL